MSYLLFLLYSVVCSLSSVRFRVNSSFEEKSEESQVTTKKRFLSGIYLFIGLGLGIWSLVTFILRGKESIPTFMQQGLILFYLIFSGFVFSFLLIVSLFILRKSSTMKVQVKVKDGHYYSTANKKLVILGIILSITMMFSLVLSIATIFVAGIRLFV